MVRKTILLAVLSIAAHWLNAQTLTNEKIDVSSSSTFNMNAVIYKPANYSTSKKYPLVIFAHGMGEAGTDINRMYNAGLPKVLKDGYKPSFEFVMVAVQATSYSVNASWLNSIIDESQKRWSIDPARIYLTGLSAGGWTIYQSQLNYDLALATKFAAVVVASGATQDTDKDNFAQWKAAKTPLWAVVGNNDASYRDQNQFMVNEVNKQVPGLASITIRSGVGHGGWNDVYNGSVKNSSGQTMWQWLYQFTRGTSGSTPPANQVPTANAGTDKSVALPTNSVAVTGSGSDADGSITSYNWTKTSGPSQFSLSSTTAASPTISNLATGSYTFRLTVTDDDGATDTDDVNVIVSSSATSTPPPPSGSKMVQVNIYGGSSAYNNAEWNNWNTNSSRTATNFKYSDGSSSSIDAVLSQQSSVSDNGSTYTTTMVTKEVGRYTSYSNTNRTLTISGLDNSKSYSIELYASRKGSSGNTTRYTIGSSSVNIVTDDNLTDKATFTSITPSGGQIVISVTKLATYNYINGFIITEAGSSGSTLPGNNAPTANAGSDRTLTLPANSVALSGSATDGDGSIASYNWSKISGPSQYSFNSTTVPNPTVSNMVTGTYVFRLTVTDNDGATDTDDVTVTVNSATTPPPPTGGSKSVKVNIHAGANAYNNAEWNNWNTTASRNSSNFDYSDGTSSSIKAVLSQQSSVSDNGSTYTTTMVAKEVGRYTSYSTSNRTLTITGLDNSKTYSIELYASRKGSSNNSTRFQIGSSTVNILTDDNLSNKATFNSITPVGGQIVITLTKLNTYNYINGFMITESAGGSVAANVAPSSNAGTDKTITLPVNNVTLTGSGTDTDGSIASYSWAKASGPLPHTFSSTAVTSPTISNLGAGNYVFRLTVTDNDGATDSDDVNVVVNSATFVNVPPSANAGADKTITLPTNNSILNGSATDADGNITSYNWTKISGPSQFTLGSPSSSSTTVTNLVAGTYTFRFTATDNSGATASDDISIVVNPQATGGAYTTHTLQFSSSGQAYFPTGTGLNWKPGDTVNIPAGNYNLIDLGNFRGDATRPITIRNHGGLVTVNNIRFDRNAQYFKLLGNGAPGITYGIKVNTVNGVGIAAAMVSDVEIAYCEITNGGTGIMIKKNPVAGDAGTQYPNYTIRNIYIHHNYLHDIEGEAMYIGHTDPSGLQQTGGLIPVRMANVEISYNTLERIDWDAIQLASATTGNKIHHNTIRNYGQITMSSQQTGIVVGGNTTADVYDNNISNGTGPAISVFGYGQIKVYNNTIENTGNDGSLNGQESIFANDLVTGPESNPKQQMIITNNIIRNPQLKGGIRVGAYENNSLASTIQNNTLYIAGAPLNWLLFYVVSNAPGSIISGNNVIR